MQQVLQKVFRPKKKHPGGRRLQGLAQILQIAEDIGFNPAGEALNDIQKEIEEERDAARIEGMIIGGGIVLGAILVIGVIGNLFGGSSKK